MNGIHNQGAVRRLKISNRHTIGTKASTRIAKWTIEMNDDNFLNEKPSQRLTYCNQNGFVKLFAHKMNDLDETSEQAWNENFYFFIRKLFNSILNFKSIKWNKLFNFNRPIINGCHLDQLVRMSVIRKWDGAMWHYRLYEKHFWNGSHAIINHSKETIRLWKLCKYIQYKFTCDYEKSAFDISDSPSGNNKNV